MDILGISAYYHDSAACLVRDGKIVAAAQEERFSRKKHDPGFPRHAVEYCLAEGGIGRGGTLGAVAFYDKPSLKFGRLLETYMGTAPGGWRSFMAAIPVWMKEKLWIPMHIEEELDRLGVKVEEDFYFPEHHESHAASAFYPSPFEKAAVLTLDGVGEWATTTVGLGDGNKLTLLEEMRFPHSIGLLYSAFTYFTGFKVNSGEYKLMGLAPYGKPKYVKEILDNLVDVREDGSFRMDMRYFSYADGLRMTNDRFAKLFGGPARKPESEITQREMDLAASIQVVTEDIVLKMARHAREVTGCDSCCMAGGVALNCVANGRLLREKVFDHLWIQPASGDAGGALGAALTVWHNAKGNPRKTDGVHDAMQGAYLGPKFDDDEIRAYLDAKGYVYEYHGERGERAKRIAELIASEKVVGCLQGRMEFGPRALGNRSILGDARSPKMQSIMNLKIKYRESFRPFAPSVLEERTADFFEMEGTSPYMLLVAQVRKDRLIPPPANVEELPMMERLHLLRSDVPAITHVDNSARVQSVTAETNPDYYAILREFEKMTGYGIVINTSFNVRGEPIVCTPEDAYRCFMRTEMDALVLGGCILLKENQPEWKETKEWKKDYVLD